MGTVHEVDERVLRELAEHRSKEETVLSLYLDHDPSEFATPRSVASELSSLLDAAARLAEEDERSHSERAALREGVQIAREELGGSRAWAREARGIALFIDPPSGLRRLLRLGHGVEMQALAGQTPFIAPLVQVGSEDRLCVALADARRARVLRGTPERLREVLSFGDEVPGRQDQGGWSQARYQRHRQESIKAHLRRLAAVLERQLRGAGYDRLLIATSEVLWPQLCDQLHADVRGRLGERLELDVAHAGIEDVTRAAAGAIARERDAYEQAVLAKLRERHAQPEANGVAVGLDDVLDALVQRRVDTLVFDVRMRVPGVRCPRCGWMASSGSSCPVDGGELARCENIVEQAAESALRQSAQALPVSDRPELGPLGGVAALLRF